MKRILSRALVLSMLCLLLSGCVHESIDVAVRADGSGTVSIKAGYDAEILREAMADADPAEAQAQLDALTPFEADGKTYYGVTGEAAFASPEGFAAALAGLAAEADELTENGGFLPQNLRLVWDGDALMLVVDNRSAEPEDDASDEPYEASEAETAARAEALLELYRRRASGFSDGELKRLAEERAENMDYCDPRDFDSYLAFLNERDAAELNDDLRYELEALDWAGLDDAARAAREEQTRAVLLDAGLTAEDAARCAEYFVDFYDFQPSSFAENLAMLREADAESLRGELDFLRSVYEDGAPEGGYDEEPVEYDGGDYGYDGDAADIVLRMTVRFDAPVTQISGGAEGVSVEGGSVTLDLTALGSEVYRFTTRAGVSLAYERSLTVELDGAPVELRCYALRYAKGAETNYVRVRDLASLLDGTQASFGVSWQNHMVRLDRGAAYDDAQTAPVPFSGARTYRGDAAKTLVDGRETALDSLTLYDEEGGGYTYYKLRDLGAALGFNVRWDAARHIVCIESDRPYTG